VAHFPSKYNPDPLRAPAPLFRKLDESVIGEEYVRLGEWDESQVFGFADSEAGARASARTGGSQELFQQCLCLNQVHGVKPFRKPVVDAGQQLAGLGAAVL